MKMALTFSHNYSQKTQKNNVMIQTKLLLLEYVTINDDSRDGKKLQAIREVKDLLRIIDFNLEDEPLKRSFNLKKILTVLKGAELSINQESLVEELIDTSN